MILLEDLAKSIQRSTLFLTASDVSSALVAHKEIESPFAAYSPIALLLQIWQLVKAMSAVPLLSDVMLTYFQFVYITNKMFGLCRFDQTSNEKKKTLKIVQVWEKIFI